MSTSEYGELRDLIGRMFEQLGGRASVGEVHQHALTSMQPHLTEYLVDRGLKRAIGDYFRGKSKSGLPLAPAVDDFGTHVQLSLLTVEEYRYIVARRMSGARANIQAAQAAADDCYEVHGVLIDVNDPMSERRAS